jgi:hypothetical protein
MWKIANALVLALFAWTILAPAGPAEAQSRGLEGYVKDAASAPIPGLSVYLVHPSVGRSYPRITDSTGHFVFHDVPYAPDPYYLEVYWGKTLMYRASVLVDRYTRWPDIILG